MDVKVIGWKGVGYIYLVQDMVLRRALVNTVIGFHKMRIIS